ncbi:uncharacterized protein LOC110721238 [Chenopodium quinoa]|uniref:uncharacterized protein LOC110721238 n=1 Tax=Chenopodium quinoa TaxID=63459 RepID=UPI000B772F8D|nr:uncharacterized protein LOC110721238 [Chenopodium quinoa]
MEGNPPSASVTVPLASTSIHSNDNSSSPLSFREVVATFSEWFDQARKIVFAAKEWDDSEDIAPDGNLAVQFSKETLSKLRQPWSMTLMGKVVGISVRQEFMAKRAQIMWKIRGNLETIDLGKSIFLFRFSLQDDYERALFGGPWFIFDHYLMITQWRPNFRPHQSQFETMAVWIRFPELPVEYYEKSALFEIARVVAKPIRVDYSTDRITRGRYARVCVEIDLNLPLITKVWFGHEIAQCIHGGGNRGKQQHSLSNVGECSHKSSFGLTDGSDRVGPLAGFSELGQSSKVQDSNGIVIGSAQGLQLEMDNSSEDSYGPWTMVTNRRKPRKNIVISNVTSSKVISTKTNRIEQKEANQLLNGKRKLLELFPKTNL